MLCLHAVLCVPCDTISWHGLSCAVYERAVCSSVCRAGFVSCGVVVLLADLVLKPHSANYTPAALQRLFQVAAIQTMVGLLSAMLLLRRNWRRLQAAGR